MSYLLFLSLPVVSIVSLSLQQSVVSCGGGGGGGGGSGGGFFLACEDFRRMFDHSFPARASFFLFFLK